ncbi:type IX secretion system plug protein [Rhodoflexus sp.]
MKHLLLLMGFWMAILTAAFAWPVLKMEDLNYQPDIRTVQLYPMAGNPMQSQLLPPVVPKGGQLILTFDKLTNEIERLAVKIINCNADWTISQLSPVEYLAGYNEFFITDRQLSFNTKVNFVHYRFEVPRVQVSGNYVLVVYEEGNERNLFLSRRFMVYESQAGISASVKNPVGVEEAFRNQQVDFSISYGALQVGNPQQQIRVMLRQNFRWDNMMRDWQPSFVRAHERVLQYDNFLPERHFKGGNEFRMFNITNMNTRLLNVGQINLRPHLNEVFIMPDENRNGWVYNRMFPDQNGRFMIGTVQGSRDPGTEADYAEVVFTFKSHELPEGKVFVSGGFSDWRLDEAFEMKYYPTQQVYQGVVLLKQGIYDYQYSLLRKDGKRDDVFLEGSHGQTQNNYEIFVYFRPFGARTDFLVGYKML